MKYIYPTLGIILFILALALLVQATIIMLQYPIAQMIMFLIGGFNLIYLAVTCFKQ